MQALGLVVGPLVAVALLGSGLGHGMVWRVLLGLGTLPAAAVVYLRTRMPQSPRFTAEVRGEPGRVAADLAAFSTRAIVAPPAATGRRPWLGARQLLLDPHLLAIVVGTAGSWFVFDYAYYGNTLSLPAILAEADPRATLLAKLAWRLGLSGMLLAAAGNPAQSPAWNISALAGVPRTRTSP